MNREFRMLLEQAAFKPKKVRRLLKLAEAVQADDAPDCGIIVKLDGCPDSFEPVIGPLVCDPIGMAHGLLGYIRRLERELKALRKSAALPPAPGAGEGTT